ncbi:hypothetical protein [Photorhabdus australis]|uniref:hypothetical protein n=1 Tax=Photorhabdus australis TaxID=286156 RepID=UPI00056D242A|nr:hypothetical protein [Photorhabdus australis]
MIKYNQKMFSFLDGYVKEEVVIPKVLAELLNLGFTVSSNGCVFFSSLGPVASVLRENQINSHSNFFDKTEEECFYNEIRLSDYLENNIIDVAIKFASLIIAKLEQDLPSFKFELILVLDDFEEEIDSVIKLHMMRENEVSYIDIDSLDEFIQPILVLQTK